MYFHETKYCVFKAYFANEVLNIIRSDINCVNLEILQNFQRLLYILTSVRYKTRNPSYTFVMSPVYLFQIFNNFNRGRARG